MADARAKLMLRAFPHPGREFDSAIITASVIKMFCEYPEATVVAVSDPSLGLPSKSRFFPTIAEVKEALEAIEAPKRVKQAAEQRIRDTQRLLKGPEAVVSQEARDKAFDHWQAQKEAMSGKEPPEVVKAKANERLREGWRSKEWDTNVNPVKVSDELRRNLAAKAKPDYVPLEVGQALQGKRDDE